MQVDSLVDRIGGLLLPPRCVLCGAAGQAPCLDLCRACTDELPELTAACLRCGLPAARGTVADLTCRPCIVEPPPYDRCFAAFEYAFPVDGLIHALKYRHQLAAGRVLGTLLGLALTRLGLHLDVDVVVPVPLHPHRHAERGFNQSAEIGGWVSRAVGRRCLERAAARLRDTPSQVGLRVDQRRANLAAAFRCTAAVYGKRAAVVDDVMTTGSTARAMALALRAAGAVSVDIWCVARALPAGPSRDRPAGDDGLRPIS